MYCCFPQTSVLEKKKEGGRELTLGENNEINFLKNTKHVQKNCRQTSMFDIQPQKKVQLLIRLTVIEAQKTKSGVNSIKIHSPRVAAIHIRICLLWISECTSRFELIFFRNNRHTQQVCHQIISEVFRMSKYEFYGWSYWSQLTRGHTYPPFLNIHLWRDSTVNYTWTKMYESIL